MDSEKSLLCILSDTFDVQDYQVLDHCLPTENRVFIGSDTDCYLKAPLLKNASCIVIDYTRITQTDSLNHLLEENSANSGTQVIGILSPDSYKQTAYSFQSRWTNYCVFHQDDHSEISMDTSQPSESSLTYPLTIFDNLYKLPEQTDSLPTSTTVQLLGADQDHPSVKYWTAQQLNKGHTVHCIPQDVPKSVQRIHSLPTAPDGQLIHTGNFDNVQGLLHIENGDIHKEPPPKTVYIISELTDSQWQYLGYLSRQQPALSICVLTDVFVPDTIGCNTTDDAHLSRNNLEVLDHIDTLQKDLNSEEPLWIHTNHHQLASIIESLYQPSRSVHQRLIHPDESFNDMMGTVTTQSGQLCYKPSALSQQLQDPTATIIFDNCDCNFLVQRELEAICSTKQFIQNGRIVQVQAKLIGLSKTPPTAFSGRYISVDSLAVTNPPKSQSSNFLANNLEDKQDMLLTALNKHSTIVLKGTSDTGKTTVLQSIIKQTTQVLSLTGSPTLSRVEVEDTLLNWINSPSNCLLVIDQFDQMQDGYWNHLLPNLQNQLLIKGRYYTIPDHCRCVLVEQAEMTDNTTRHQISQLLPTVQFNTYSERDVLNTIYNMDTDSSFKDWCITTYSVCKDPLGKELTLLDLSTLQNWYHYYTQTLSCSAEDARTIALYQLLSLSFKPSDLRLLSQVLPVCTDSWNSAADRLHSSLTASQSHPFLTTDQKQIYTLLQTQLNSKGTHKYPIVCIQGEAGCGKDFVVDTVLNDSSKPYIRVKGSSMQDVLEAAKKAKQEGLILIIEEADLTCPHVLKSLLNPLTDHPNFSIIMTINGMSYAGRQPIPNSLLSKALVFSCQSVLPNDLLGMLTQKFSDKLSRDDLNLLTSLYQTRSIPVSPREVLNIASESIRTKQPIHTIWTRHISVLEQIREPLHHYTEGFRNKF